MNELTHPAVLSAHGGGVCPEQWEGQLLDGRYFYLRVRHSHAQLGIGWNSDDAVGDTIEGECVGMEIGEWRDDRGYFEDNAELTRVFTELLQRRAPELVWQVG